MLKKLLLIILLIASPIFAKDVYMWKDDGVYKYGDEKPDKQYAIVLEENAQKIINSLKMQIQLNSISRSQTLNAC